MKIEKLALVVSIISFFLFVYGITQGVFEHGWFNACAWSFLYYQKGK